MLPESTPYCTEPRHAANHQADPDRAAGRARRRRRRPGRACSHRGKDPEWNCRWHAGHRRIPRLAHQPELERTEADARCLDPVDPVDIVALTRALVTSIRQPDAKAKPGRGWPTASAARFDVTEQPVDGERCNDIAIPGSATTPAVVLLHPLRLRAAVLFQPRRRRSTLRTRRVRRQGNPGGASAGDQRLRRDGESPSDSCSSSARSAERRREQANGGAGGTRFAD